MGLGDLLHPLRLAEDIPGVSYGAGLAGKTLSDIFSTAENAPGGIYTLGRTAITHPGQLPSLFEQMGKQTLTDFEHPLRHPGFTALDLLGIAGVPGAILGRGLAVGAVASRAAEIGRAGALPEELATADAARAAGKLSERGRIVDPVAESQGLPLDQQLRSTGSQYAKALAFGPAKEARLIDVPMTPAHTALDTPAGVVRQSGWMYSKDPLIKAAQKQIDKMYVTHPELLSHPYWRIVPGFQRSPAGRLSSAIKADQFALKKEAAGKGAAFLREFNHMDAKDWLTLRMVAERTTPEDLIKMHTEAIGSGTLTPKQLAETKARLEQIPEVAAERIDFHTVKDPETGTERSVPILKQSYADEHPDLVKFINDAREISKDREWASEMAGVLDGEGKFRRITAPFEFARTGKLPVNIEHINRSLAQHRRLGNKVMVERLEAAKNDLLGQQNLFVPEEHMTGEFKDDAERARFAQAETPSGEMFRVPYAYQKQGFIKAGSTAYRRAFKGGKPTVPGTFTHPFTASIMKTGGGEQNVARLLAETYTEAHRYLGLKSIRNKLLLSAVDDPSKIPEEYRQLIKTDERLPGQIPQKKAEQLAREGTIPPSEGAGQIAAAETAGSESLMDKPGRISPLEAIAGGRLYEGVRQRLFPNMDDVKSLNLAPEGYKWIDKRMLGDLHKPNPLIGLYEQKIAAKILRGVDTVNSGIKSTMLFLRPAYLLPNMLGNVALNLVQQGAFAPYHIARNYVIYRGLSPRTRTLIRAQMGEGVESIAFEKGAGGIGARTEEFSRKASKVYGKVMDDPFRMNAFLHEAAQMGYDSPARVEKLMNDSKLQDALRQVTSNANDEIINYERMGPGEEALLRRLVLFYPFTKGASRYAINFTKTHPIASGISSTTGQYSEDRTAEIMGALPPYLAGAFPSDASGSKIINPSSFSILGEPAMLGRQLLNLVSGHPESHLELSQNLAPVDAALLDILTGGKSATLGHLTGAPNLNIASGEAVGGVPFISLINQLRGKSSAGGPLGASIYPTASTRDALIRYFGAGGLWPRPVNQGLLNYKAYQASQGQ